MILSRLRSWQLSPLTESSCQLIRGDVRDAPFLEQLFSEAKTSNNTFEAVIHFDGLKAVGESVANPLRYWDLNVYSS